MNHEIEEPTLFLLDILDKYDVVSVFYILGLARDSHYNLYREIVRRGHLIGDHGYYHTRGQNSLDPLFRSPYWDTTPMPWPPSGGFFFRAMPFNYVKWAVETSGHFWIHPHDVMLKHPKLTNSTFNWKRHINLKGARVKLDRLLNEVAFEDPTEFFYASAS